MMVLNGYDTPEAKPLSTRCSTQSTQLSYLVHIAQHGNRRHAASFNLACRRKSSPVGTHFGGSRGGTISRKPWNKDGTHKRVFPPYSMISACRWGTEYSVVSRPRTTAGCAVGTARERTGPSAMYANISATTPTFVVAPVRMPAGEGDKRSN